jgi:threonylcarbamoyladenosine tRNA methylthiotransferase MtaB
MPAVDGSLIKSRAAQLRAAGERRVALHLAAQVDQTHQILMESPTMGRTAQFAPTHFAKPQIEGQIVTTRVLGTQENVLTALDRGQRI